MHIVGTCPSPLTWWALAVLQCNHVPTLPSIKDKSAEFIIIMPSLESPQEELFDACPDTKGTEQEWLLNLSFFKKNINVPCAACCLPLHHGNELATY